MDIVSREELGTLMADRHEHCVSLFLPTHRAGAEIQQDAIRLKNLLRTAEEHLVNLGMRSTEVKTMLAPVYALVDNSLFWHYQSDGLAVFVSPNTLRTFRVPLAFDEMCLVSHGFQLKRLLPLFSTDATYHILALSKKHVHLYLGTRDTVSELDIDTIPKSLAEVLQYDEYEQHVQYRSNGRGGAVFHGHGSGEENAKENLLQYFRKIDKGLAEFLGNTSVPLVLAGVEYLLPIYREANSYAHLLPQGIVGSPDHMSIEELHKRSWDIVRPHALQKQHEAAERYNSLKTSNRVSNDIRHLLVAALQGRVDTLFVGTGVQYWGTYHPDTFDVTLHKDYQQGDRDLLNKAALYTLLNKGTVYAVQGTAIPDDLPVAGILRY